jgi:hypothetical protein
VFTPICFAEISWFLILFVFIYIYLCQAQCPYKMMFVSFKVTRPEHLLSPLFFVSWIFYVFVCFLLCFLFLFLFYSHAAQYLIFCAVFLEHCLFLLAIVLYVLLRYMDPTGYTAIAHLVENVVLPYTRRISSYITNLVCYTYFHWFHNPECQHIFGKQTGYIFLSPKTIKTWTTKHYASLNQWYNTE